MEEDAMVINSKMSGYLEKKGKMRMVSTWKKYWFVLEGRLLLYYRSKDEYATLSPCKGSINLGPPCAIKPSISCCFQIETRTSTITLRAEDSFDQKKWMQAIMFALNQHIIIKDNNSGARLSHFRYSLDNLVPKFEEKSKSKKKNLERQNTMPNRFRLNHKKCSGGQIIQRLQKIGAQSYGGSLGAINKMASSRKSLSDSQKSISINGEEQLILIDNNNIKLDDNDGRNAEIREKKNIYGKLLNSKKRMKSYLVDNEGYGVFSNGRKSNEINSLIIDNEEYHIFNKSSIDEVIYSEPKFEIDHNKNSIEYESVKSEIKSTAKSTENVYEDLYDYSELLEKSNNEKFNNCAIDKKSSSKTEKNYNKEKKLKKSRSFLHKVWKKRKNKKSDEKIEISDEGAIKMLSELHNILENKKPLILKKSLTSDLGQPSSSEDASMISVRGKNGRPQVPPKIKPKNNKSIKSIDEILQDLDAEKNCQIQNNPEFLLNNDDDDVVLRDKSARINTENLRHSDELTRLLEELTKVTSAPIMTPGVTTSLINPNLTDEEWLKLLPIRQRRLSEPDYDIPRPHKFLQKSKEITDQSSNIEATRFFGPVLNNSETSNNGEDDSIVWESMAPDSLEVSTNKQPTFMSYMSHSYPAHDCNIPNIQSQIFKRDSHNFGRKLHDEQVIYAQPKPHISLATHVVNTCPSICSKEHTIIYKNVRNFEGESDEDGKVQEVFQDSLELCPEASTAF